MSTQEFIEKYRQTDAAKAALIASQYPEVDRVFAIRQIDGYQRAKDKLPELSHQQGWIWPPRINLEQCSSEQTAKYKRSIIDRLSSQLSPLHPQLPTTITDLTGGFGIDAYYMGTTDYVEQNAELCEIVAHNMALTARPTRIHNTTAEAYLNGEAAQHTARFIYLDPARRDSHGGKVFRLEDCTPNIVELYPTLMNRCEVLMLKLSPMLDITEALRRLPDAREVHIVAVKNEVKEVLIVCHTLTDTLRYTCVNLDSNDPVLEVYEADDIPSPALVAAHLGTYLYEPNAAIMKAGLYSELSHQYELAMLAENSHLYTSDTLVENFPGRIWTAHEATKEELKSLSQANILTRNYPLRPEEIKKKYRLRDGGTTYLIGTRTIGGPTLLIGERLR